MAVAQAQMGDVGSTRVHRWSAGTVVRRGRRSHRRLSPLVGTDCAGGRAARRERLQCAGTAVVTLPFDPARPPPDSPAGCDAMTWRLAYQIYVDHTLASDSVCKARTCRALFTNEWPCQPRILAESGLLASVGTWAGTNADRPPTRWAANAMPP